MSSCGIKDEKDFEGGSTATCRICYECLNSYLFLICFCNYYEQIYRVGAIANDLHMVKTVLYELVKLRGTAIKGHLSMVPIDMETQPIILAYIDVNLQTLAAAKMLTPTGPTGQTYWGDSMANNPMPAANFVDVQLKVDISSLLQNASEVVEKICLMEKNVAAGKACMRTRPATPVARYRDLPCAHNEDDDRNESMDSGPTYITYTFAPNNKYDGGLDSEEAYPYTGVDGVCKYSSENAAIRVLETVNITVGAQDE
ncbi:protein MOR1, partial [Tanacetum coccineum]